MIVIDQTLDLGCASKSKQQKQKQCLRESQREGEKKKASYGARCPGTGEKVGVSSSEGAMALRRPGVIISLVKLARSWVMSGAPSSLRFNATGVKTDETPEMSSLLGVESAWREGSNKKKKR